MARRLAALGEQMSVLHEPAAEPASTHTRIRPDPGVDAVVDPVIGWEVVGEVTGDVAGEGPPAVALPAPGRHAARRAPTAAVAGLFGPAQVTVLALSVALALAVTCWWLLRSGTDVVPVAAASAPPLVTPGAPTSDGADPTAAATAVVVDVAGRVRQPGIAVLAPGARVVDAIEAAGGARRGVNLTALNLARQLVDGEQILVGVSGGPAPAVAAPATGGETLLVNINSAGQAELESLPEVGPVTAQAILSWREAHGAFTSVDQLLDVDGIGEATLHTVTPFVTV